MGASLEDAYIKRLQEDIQIACDRLEEAGCNSLVIVASGFSHIKMGSKKGINYLADFTSFIEGFSHYCQADTQHDQNLILSVANPQKIRKSERISRKIKGEITNKPEIARSTPDETGSTQENAISTQEKDRSTPENALSTPGKAGSAPENDRSIPENDRSRLEEAMSTSDKDKPIPEQDRPTPDRSILEKARTTPGAEDCLVELLTGDDIMDINDDGTLKDSDGDSAMSGVEENDNAEEKNKIDLEGREMNVSEEMKIKGATVIVVKKDEIAAAMVRDAKSNLRPKRKKRLIKKSVAEDEFPEIRQFSCDRCNKVYKRNDDLKIHMRKHDGIFPFVCSVCQKGFLSKKMLMMHEPVHFDSKPYPCDQCPKQYTRKEDLKIHMRKHTGETPYKCEICPEGFIGRKQLKSHKATVHGERPHKCEYCDREYAHLEDLRSHQNQHTGARPYTCTQCNETFSTRGEWRVHGKQHLDPERHVCETCGKSFSRKHNLDRHKLIHTDNVVGWCNICDKSFNDSSTLRRHQMRHNGQKQFTCKYCSKQFWSKYLLDAHERLHTGEKPYKCEICGLEFVLKRYLTKHQGTVHKKMTSDAQTEYDQEEVDEDHIEGNQRTAPLGVSVGANQRTVPIHHLGRAQRSILAANPSIGLTTTLNTVYQAHKTEDGNTVLVEVTNVVNSPDVLTEGPAVQNDVDTKTELILDEANLEIEGECVEYSEIKEEGGLQQIVLEELLKQAGTEVTIVLKK